jgi:undecaprenyl phosphate N,N'-diacetylbacillosamine 1-phosphate transferase
MQSVEESGYIALPVHNGLYRKYFKRILDLTLSLLAIIVLSPFLLLLAVLVRIKIGSPIIFKQERLGYNEKIFTLYKFRTMTNNKDGYGKLLPDRERITRFGMFLRRTSLDELPELFNILKGDMSFVGPRPLLIEYLPYYSKTEKCRHKVRPGLSGLAQINGRNLLGWDKRLGLDIDYVNKLSFLLDIKIIIKTIIKVLKREDVIIEEGILEDFVSERRKKSIRNTEV